MLCTERETEEVKNEEVEEEDLEFRMRMKEGKTKMQRSTLRMKSAGSLGGGVSELLPLRGVREENRYQSEGQNDPEVIRKRQRKSDEGNKVATFKREQHKLLSNLTHKCEYEK